MDEKRLTRIEQRLQRVESALDETRILAIVLVLMILALVVVPQPYLFIGGMVLVVLAGLGAVVYAGLATMDRAMKRRLGSEEERMDQIMERLIQETAVEDD